MNKFEHMNKFETLKENLQFSPLPTKDILESRKLQAQDLFSNLRDDICAAFEKIEGDSKFTRSSWKRQTDGEIGGGGDIGGGGETSVMRARIFEKVGVNISMVEGNFSPQFSKEIAGTKADDSRFWASGISLVAHMRNPHVPSVHMNLRMICTGACWFGGANDINGALPRQEITDEFHESLRRTCDRHDRDYYGIYKGWCDNYFYLPNRQCARGQGGIFFDYLDSGDWEADFSYTASIGRNFLDIYPMIVRKLFCLDYSDDDIEELLKYRGRYAEFNLLYDRGTRFGLQTGGNTEAILMSLPPLASW